MAKGFSKGASGGGIKSVSKPGRSGGGLRMGGGGRSFRSHGSSGGGNSGGSWFGMGGSGRSWAQAPRPARGAGGSDSPSGGGEGGGTPVDAFGLAQDAIEATGWLGHPWLRWAVRLALVAAALWIVLRLDG